jgi:putative transposase
MPVIEIQRAYRVALDLTPMQVKALRSHAGASRWAFNFALGAKIAAREVWLERVEELVRSGVPEVEARKSVRVRTPGRQVLDKVRVRIRGTGRSGKPESPDWTAAEKILIDDGCDAEVAVRILRRCIEECIKRGIDPLDGIQPWAPEVTNAVIQRGEVDADVAWDNWMKSATGKRKGRQVGFPRFKSKGKSRDTFYVTNTEFSLNESRSRRIRLGGKIGWVRTAEPLRRIRRAISRRSGRVLSVTVSRGGSRWYASILMQETVNIPDRPNRRQRQAGTVGVDLGVKVAAAVSTGEVIENPRIGRRDAKRLKKAQQAFFRTEKGSNRRRRAARKVAGIQHLTAQRRATFIHGLTKRLATGFAVVGIEDLNVAGMTRSSKGTVDKPGKRVRQKAGLNREMLDVAPGEFRRQLEYKTIWYGSKVALCGRFEPSSQTCSACGVRAKTKLTLSDRIFRCEACGIEIDRDLNAAINIASWAVIPVVSDKGKTLNARREDASPTSLRTDGRTSTKREGQPSGRSPCSSNAAASP